MPSTTSPVGAVSIPLEAGDAGDAVTDPVVEGVLDFAAWTLNDALGSRTANWPSYGASGYEAVPMANRFAWNPLEPQGQKVKLPVPGLWVWWHGPDKSEQFTVVLQKRSRQLRLLYLVPELPKQAELARRAGLLSTASAALHRMSKWQRHPSYGYGDSADGTRLDRSLADAGLVSIELLGCEQVRFGIDDGAPRVPNPAAGARKSGRDYPGLAAIFNVEELVGPKSMKDPDDLNRDHLVTINGGDTDESIEILQGIVGAPDGSEDL